MTRPGAISSSVASVTAIKAGPRVQELTMPVQSLILFVTAAKAPRTENASRASRVSVTHADSKPSRSIFCTSSICFETEGRSRKQKPSRSICIYDPCSMRKARELMDPPQQVAAVANITKRRLKSLSHLFSRSYREGRFLPCDTVEQKRHF